MKYHLILPLMCLGFMTTAQAQTRTAHPEHHNLLMWYKKPAETWTQALPIGNGRFGAMIFGEPEKEKLQLNEITVWSGDPQPDADRKGAYKYLDTIRKVIAAGDYKGGEALTAKYMTSPAPYDASYQTLGNINIDFNLQKKPVRNYQRWLDIDQAVSGVSFTAGEDTYTREVFASAPDQAIVMNIQSTSKNGLSFETGLSRIERAITVASGNNTLIMTGNTGNTLSYEVQLRILPSGGSVSVKGNKLVVSNAKSAIIIVTTATSYILDYAKGFRGPSPHAAAEKNMASVSKQTYANLKMKHEQDYRRFFRRVSLNLGDAPLKKLPTDERLKAYGDGKADPAFAALFYQFGRYLLISSSRPDNPLPSNAQGIWGDGLDLPWKCDYKSNINFQMNYWPAEGANLGDLQLPMIKFIKALVAPGKQTAREYFGPQTPGWYYGYTTNGWAWTSPGAALPWGVFNGGSGWACQHLWEHYAYSLDKEYLKSVYPVLKGAAAFYLATMVRDQQGNLITSPSTSPENHFITDKGVKSTVTQGATMEKAIVWDLFDNVIKACEVLHTDPDFKAQLVKAKNEISPLKIGHAGQLEEWNGDWDTNTDDPGHRHVSHLFPLFPGHQIDYFNAPKLASAVKKSLELRGDDGTGWSIAWKENLWAKLRDGDHVHRLLSDQLRYTQETRTIMADAGGTYPNLFDAHPPFQIDGNFGAVSGISQMFLQNSGANRDIIDILPALPSAWSKGNVNGLKAYNGFEVSINWNNSKLEQLTIKSLNGGICKVRTASPIKVLSVKSTTVKDKGGYLTTFNSQKNKSYSIRKI